MMIQEKLKNLRKQKGLSQEMVAKILSTDSSNYSRKERGDVRIHDKEWEKLADALGVTVDAIKENDSKISIDNDKMFYENLESHNQYFNIPIPVMDNLQDYIKILKEQVEILKQEIISLKSQK
ncbi:helix-turn-helix domain-containing protein [Chryseobacterium indologenes]|uniref:helix-turn-helix domain-containing protein n=1 Tax=Chryseobacterium indologenes TaxID=253 RepID=UPI001E2B32C1|nr:helix-turn-helix transcriptional regulator [Chryseobacterium indologenes]